ncbi:HNH endonuclease domain-containing protein [Kistimonas asteriae]|uniref:HNH endonuclease domain-containing protein n=1 Tax=Kistimonas asteriae TaxID=517724 RepID=UPI001BA81B2F|nr:HNH endonuclease domain-containing protein [Kistimonas asteriae]
MSRFYEVEPSLENYWRAIILFGKNSSSYKFALAKALYEFRDSASDLITLDALAEPFSRHVCTHIHQSSKQSTRENPGRFLDACADFNNGVIPQEQLLDQTVRLGFENVIDAFHNVARKTLDTRFFEDERKGAVKAIRLTDHFFRLAEQVVFADIQYETEARWRLVETAWQSNISKNLLAVQHDHDAGSLFVRMNDRRIDITSCRDSLNGYQKGRCFYCYDTISIDSSADNLADVDHFFPWCIRHDLPAINGIWNLVLACTDCNRGEGGKFERVPALSLLERLHARNEYFINSHLPIRETLIKQTGKTELQRQQFLQSCYGVAKTQIIHTWRPKPKGGSTL